MNKLYFCFLFVAILFFSSSCSVYKSFFDCPPPSGIPCASVTEIESMIIETQEGSDLIIYPETVESQSCFWCGQRESCSNPLPHSQRKIWICSQKKNNTWIKGHYFKESEVYFPQSLEIESEDILDLQVQEEGN